MMTDRENLVRTLADGLREVREELELVDALLDPDGFMYDTEAASDVAFRTKLAVEDIASELLRLSRELSAEGFTRNYPDARALGQ